MFLVMTVVGIDNIEELSELVLHVVGFGGSAVQVGICAITSLASFFRPAKIQVTIGDREHNNTLERALQLANFMTDFFPEFVHGGGDLVQTESKQTTLFPDNERSEPAICIDGKKAFIAATSQERTYIYTV